MKKLSKKSLVTIFVVILLLTMFTVSSIAATEATTLIRLAIGDPIGSSVGVVAKYFAEKVYEATNGQIKVEVFPDGVLFGGDQNAAINMAEDGSLDAIIIATDVYASFEKRMNAVGLPYLFKDYDEFQSYITGELGKELLASLENLNQEGLVLMIRTFRCITNSKRPIYTPKDLEGLKLRVPNSILYMEFFGPLGANPTPMDFKEVYTALQLKTIDGQENPVEVPLANKFYEVQKYLSLTNHSADSYILAFNLDLWKKLNADTQEIVRRAAEEAAQFKLEYDLGEEEIVIKELEAKGMEVNRLTVEQKNAFQEEALKLYPRFESLVGSDFMERSLEFLKNLRMQ